MISFSSPNPKSFSRCKLLHLMECGSELPSPLSAAARQMNPQQNTCRLLSFFGENLPISASGIWRWESRASGTPPFFHQVNKEIDFSSAMLAKPQACF